MKKLIATGYGLTVVAMLMLQSCEDGPIVPNTGGNETDTTWVTDSTDVNINDNGGDTDPTDSTDNGGGNNGGNVVDSTTWGGGDPSDSLGGN